MATDRCPYCGFPNPGAVAFEDCPDKPAPPPTWAVEAGRCLTFDGEPLLNVYGITDATGYRYIPAELDTLTHALAAALNTCKVDGSRVPRRKS